MRRRCKARREAVRVILRSLGEVLPDRLKSDVTKKKGRKKKRNAKKVGGGDPTVRVRPARNSPFRRKGGGTSGRTVRWEEKEKRRREVSEGGKLS